MILVYKGYKPKDPSWFYILHITIRKIHSIIDLYSIL